MGYDSWVKNNYKLQTYENKLRMLKSTACKKL